MSLAPIDSLPPDARVWCYGSDRSPSGEAVEKLRSSMKSFLEAWTAHRAELRAGFAWLHDRFLVIAVDESRVGASGCSIDALAAEVRRLEETTGVSLLDASPIWFREAEGSIRRVDRDEFRRLAREGGVDAGTRVFDLTVARLGSVRDGSWEVEAGRSWHARLL